MTKSIWTALLLSLSSLILVPSVSAHGGGEPEHGGQVKVEHDLAFELVRHESSVSLYIKDHGKPYASEGLSGEITVLAAGKKQSGELKPAGANMMTAPVAVPDDAKVLIKVKSGGHHGITVRYSF